MQSAEYTQAIYCDIGIISIVSLVTKNIAAASNAAAWWMNTIQYWSSAPFQGLSLIIGLINNNNNNNNKHRQYVM